MSSYISASSPVASTTVVTNNYTNFKNNESIFVTTKDKSINILHIILVVVVVVLVFIILLLLYMQRRRANTRVTERPVRFASLVSLYYNYDSVDDVTDFPQHYEIASRSGTSADIIRNSRVQNTEFSSFKGT
jgi:preprotein translocase subunit SecG